MRKYINNIIGKFGYELTHTHTMKTLYSKTFDYHLKSLFKLLDIQCVLDVGANTGGYRKFLRKKVGYQGLILSFEPIAKQVEILKQKAAKDSQWFIYDFALGNEDSEKQMNSMKKGNFSSFLEPDKSIIDNPNNVVEEKEQVVVKKLDTIIKDLKKEHKIKNIYLKMDTQGYDLEVIKGANNTISEVLALQTEMAIKKIYKNMPDFTEVYHILHQ